MRNVFLLCLLLLGNCILESCCSNEDQCFELALTAIKNFSLNGNSELTTLDTVNAKDYAILMEAETIDKICFNHFSFGANLYATSCDDPLYILKDEVIHLSITSNARLSVNYAAGSELKELFIPVELNSNCLGESDNSYNCLRDYSFFEGIDSLEDAFNEIMAMNLYIKGKENLEFELMNLFALNTEEIITENTHQFTINFEFESGKIVELVSSEVRIEY
jgi:hypothetical protein